MAYHTTIDFGDERYREGLSGAERLDDELLRVIADLQGPKRGYCHLGDRPHIELGFAPDNNLRIHGFLIPLPIWPTSRVTGPGEAQSEAPRLACVRVHAIVRTESLVSETVCAPSSLWQLLIPAYQCV